MSAAPRVTLYVPSWAADDWEVRLADHAIRHGWHVDTLARHWTEVVQLVRADQLDLVLVGDRSHLPPDRTPRVIALTDPEPDATGCRPRITRPRLR